MIDDPHPTAEGHFGGLLVGTSQGDAIFANGGNGEDALTCEEIAA